MEATLKQSLLPEANNCKCGADLATDYTAAGVLSRATFSWMNALLSQGAHKTLHKDDVPSLAPEHRAATLHSLFGSKWAPVCGDGARRPTVLRTLWRSFWKQFLYCGLLALTKASVMFIGPLLIQLFVDHASQGRYELVAALVAAKAVEVVAAHQYNFACGMLGMQARSALITSLFRKGLRLSSASRRLHGVGPIVNYMSVDAQQLADAALQLHLLWAVPAQIAAAAAVLVSVAGVATAAGLAVMGLAAAATLAIAAGQKGYQERIMEGRDRRMKAFNEALSNMKVIKLQGWEERFLQGVEDARAVELFWLSKYVYSTALNIFALWLAPLASCVAVFAACIYLDVPVTPALAFTTIATVRTMQEPMRVFPQALIAISQAMMSLRRLDRFLGSNELDEGAVARLPFGGGAAVCVEAASFKWDPDEEKPSLSNINMRVLRGSLVAVVGKVGSGKTSLLASLLGEMHKSTGKVELSGSTAYVAQCAWIQHGTIEDNILFGLPMERARYEGALRTCALLEDLRQLKLGDKTEIGERGINLSGGQRQRVQLARAVYQDRDIYLLDDVFSAVDAHTGSQIFEECIVDGLGEKTVVLVTHQIEFLHRADSILVMRDGTIVQSGRYEELLEVGLDFESLVKVHNEAMEKVGPVVGPVLDSSWLDEYKPAPFSGGRVPATPLLTPLSSSCESVLYFDPPSFEGPPRPGDPEGHLPRPSSAPFLGPLFISPSYAETDTGPVKLIEDEARATGRVSGAVYWLYLTTAFGGSVALALVFTQVLWQLLQILGDYWVAYQTSGSTPGQARKFASREFLAVYAELAAACVLCVLVRSSLVAFTGLLTSQAFYLKMLRAVFRAPMSFFDTTPTGRILSRASTDQAQLDIIVPILFGGLLAVGFASAGILLVVAQVTWQILIAVIPLAWIYCLYQAYYIKTSRELTRVDALTKAPVIHHFSETIKGFVTIRCFGHEERFAQANMRHVDTNLRMDFHNNAANEWVGFRLEVLGTAVLCVTAVLLVSLPPSFLRPELVGLSLSYALSFNGTLFNAVCLVCQLENKMVSVERIAQYTNLPAEAPAIAEETRPPASWPSKGTIKFKDLKVRYCPNTPLVLKGVTATVKGGSKVGVVGRTGSGKSSLVLALFRLVEAASGSIIVDKIDVSTLGLRALRTALSIVPQDPTLFAGTVRSNLDPAGQYSDHEIWEALGKCQLAGIVQQLKAKLESPVTENELECGRKAALLLRPRAPQTEPHRRPRRGDCVRRRPHRRRHPDHCAPRVRRLHCHQHRAPHTHRHGQRQSPRARRWVGAGVRQPVESYTATVVHVWRLGARTLRKIKQHIGLEIT